MYLPGIPAHVVQRGNNRQACFFSDDDYRLYLEILGQGLRRYGVALHAYVLMTNHVHLLMTPEYEDSVSRVMQHVGRLYVLHINRTYQRTGTLWEGRHKASLIDAERYLLACYRYIELNPVAAGMVKRPDDYPWSSYRCHAWGEADSLVVDHDRYRCLHIEQAGRQRAYRELFMTRLPDGDVHAIGEALAYNYPLGNHRFRDEIEGMLGRRVGFSRRGRPRKVH
jgi:putative transposase